MTTSDASVHSKTLTSGFFHNITGHEPKSQSNMCSMQLFMTTIQSFTIEINLNQSIQITRPSKDTIKMNQPALTQRVVDSLGLKDHRGEIDLD